MTSNNTNPFYQRAILSNSSFDSTEDMIEFMQLLQKVISSEEANIKMGIRSMQKKQILTSVHRVKSNFRICGFVPLFEMSNELEKKLMTSSMIDVAEINNFCKEMQKAKEVCATEIEYLNNL